MLSFPVYALCWACDQWFLLSPATIFAFYTLMFVSAGRWFILCMKRVMVFTFVEGRVAVQCDTFLPHEERGPTNRGPTTLHMVTLVLRIREEGHQLPGALTLRGPPTHTLCE